MFAFTIVSHQALLDVADVRKKVADGRNLFGEEWGGSRVITGNCGNLPTVTAIVTRALLEGEMKW